MPLPNISLTGKEALINTKNAVLYLEVMETDDNFWAILHIFSQGRYRRYSARGGDMVLVNQF